MMVRPQLGSCVALTLKGEGYALCFTRRSDWTQLSSQRIKLVGKRHLVSAFDQELPFANHVHEFDKVTMDKSGANHRQRWSS
jgi:hypothetical protein